MLKVAIIGCGKIADAHASQIQRIKGCEIVAVCDSEPLMARQLWERFPVKSCFSDVETLLHESRPDVVHITTSPEVHYGLARACLAAGCHVYVEKPFTLYESEARDLIEFAEARGLKVTAGHDDQFSHVSRRMRELVRSGYLGGAPAHMESYYCYDLGNSSYARALLADKDHWVRKLPGRLLHNIISHGVARIAEYILDDSPKVTAYGATSRSLEERGETEIIDELRVTIVDGNGATAYFTVSSQMRPSLHMFRIYGEKNGLTLDQDQEILIKLRGTRHKSYAEMFIPPLEYTRQYLANLCRNLNYFAKSDFHLKSGLKYLIESFYRSVEHNSPVPIPYREILVTARIMDAIFFQLRDQHDRLTRPTESSV